MKSVHEALARLEESRQLVKASTASQSDLFAGSSTELSPEELTILDANKEPPPAQDASNASGKRAKLLPVRHVERDFFLCDMFDYAMKDDGASMEAPIFTLSTRPDLTVWHWVLAPTLN